MIKLRAMREKRRMTQMELAALSGITQQAISKIESGERSNPGAITLYKLARALKCTVDDLIEDDEGRKGA